MIPILACSVIALMVCIERTWVLRRTAIAPTSLLPEIEASIQSNGYIDDELLALLDQYPSGKILAAGLRKTEYGVDAIKNTMEETASMVIFDLQRYLTLLGTIASISPLLGLLGTVIGMIQVFTELVISGGGDPSQLASGISQALVTTAFGLGVAILALTGYRYFMRRVDQLIVHLEWQASRLVDILVVGYDLDSKE